MSMTLPLGGKMALKKVDKHYQIKAKQFVNMMYDKNFINPEITRESMDWLEDFTGFAMQLECEMAVKVATLSARLKKDE